MQLLSNTQLPLTIPLLNHTALCNYNTSSTLQYITIQHYYNTTSTLPYRSVQDYNNTLQNHTITAQLQYITLLYLTMPLHNHTLLDKALPTHDLTHRYSTFAVPYSPLLFSTSTQPSETLLSIQYSNYTLQGYTLPFNYITSLYLTLHYPAIQSQHETVLSVLYNYYT